MTGIPVVGSQTVFNGQMPGEIYFWIFFGLFYEWSICWRSPLTSSRSMCWCLVKHVTLLKVPCQANCSFFIWEDFYQCLWFSKFFKLWWDKWWIQIWFMSVSHLWVWECKCNREWWWCSLEWEWWDPDSSLTKKKSNCHFQHFVTIVFVT